MVIAHRSSIVSLTLLLLLPLAGSMVAFQAGAAQVLECYSIEKLNAEAEDMELSGLAYSADDDTLYAVGDGGILVSLGTHFTGDRLVKLDWLGSTRLSDAAGNPLSGAYSDSEGMVAQYAADGIVGNTVLWISFEHEVRACRYSPDGSLVDCPPLAGAIADIENYSKPNAALESIGIYPAAMESGQVAAVNVAVAAERPLKQAPGNTHVIYDTRGNELYRIPAYSTGAGLSGIEFMPDGSILVAGAFLFTVAAVICGGLVALPARISRVTWQQARSAAICHCWQHATR